VKELYLYRLGKEDGDETPWSSTGGKVYCIDLRGLGSQTFLKKAKKGGHRALRRVKVGGGNPAERGGRKKQGKNNEGMLICA